MNPKAGGPVEGIRQWSSLLTERGHFTEIATFDDPSDFSNDNVELKINALGPVSGFYGFTQKWAEWLEENIHRFDLVVIHGIWQYHSFGGWRVLKKNRVPYVVYTHGMLDPWFKRTFPLKHFKKWLYWPWADYRVLRDAGAVIFTTEQERRLASKSFWLYQAKEKVLPYGIRDPKRLDNGYRENPKELKESEESSFKLLFLARLHPKKNIEILLEAFSLLLQTMDYLRLTIVGSEYQEGYLKTLTQRAHADLKIPVDRIEWIGFAQGVEKARLFQETNLYVLPSHQENFGITVVEALAYGRPVVISSAVNLAEEIANEGVGGVFDGSLDSLISTLKYWIRFEKSNRETVREKCRALFLKRYELSKGVENWEKAMELLIYEKK